MSITPVYLSIKPLDFPCYAGLPLFDDFTSFFILTLL